MLMSPTSPTNGRRVVTLVGASVMRATFGALQCVPSRELPTASLSSAPPHHLPELSTSPPSPHQLPVTSPSPPRPLKVRSRDGAPPPAARAAVDALGVGHVHRRRRRLCGAERKLPGPRGGRARVGRGDGAPREAIARGAVCRARAPLPGDAQSHRRRRGRVQPAALPRRA